MSSESKRVCAPTPGEAQDSCFDERVPDLFPSSAPLALNNGTHIQVEHKRDPIHIPGTAEGSNAIMCCMWAVFSHYFEVDGDNTQRKAARHCSGETASPYTFLVMQKTNKQTNIKHLFMQILNNSSATLNFNNAFFHTLSEYGPCHSLQSICLLINSSCHSQLINAYRII